MPVDAYNASIILKCLHTPIMLKIMPAYPTADKPKHSMDLYPFSDELMELPLTGLHDFERLERLS